jgi:hypothetical protein
MLVGPQTGRFTIDASVERDQLQRETDRTLKSKTVQKTSAKRFRQTIRSGIGRRERRQLTSGIDAVIKIDLVEVLELNALDMISWQ